MAWTVFVLSAKGWTNWVFSIYVGTVIFCFIFNPLPESHEHLLAVAAHWAKNSLKAVSCESGFGLFLSKFLLCTRLYAASCDFSCTFFPASFGMYSVIPKDLTVWYLFGITCRGGDVTMYRLQVESKNVKGEQSIYGSPGNPTPLSV